MPKNGWLGMPTSMRFSASPTITFFCFAQVLSPLLRSLLTFHNGTTAFLRKNTQPLRLETKNILPFPTNVFSL